MKKIFFAMLVAASISACTDSATTSTEEKKDSTINAIEDRTDSAQDKVQDMADTTVNKLERKSDSLKDKVEEKYDKIDSANKK